MKKNRASQKYQDIALIQDWTTTSTLTMTRMMMMTMMLPMKKSMSKNNTSDLSIFALNAFLDRSPILINIIQQRRSVTHHKGCIMYIDRCPLGYTYPSAIDR